MQNILLIWASLSISLSVIGVAGVKLSRYGDIIAEKSGLSRGWIGLLLFVIYLLNTLFLHLYGH